MQKLKTVLFTDDIRMGMDLVIKLVDAQAQAHPDLLKQHQLREANGWIRHQMERIRVERQRKSAQRQRTRAIAAPKPITTALPPNTPPVKWPKFRLDQDQAA